MAGFKEWDEKEKHTEDRESIGDIRRSDSREQDGVQSNGVLEAKQADDPEPHTATSNTRPKVPPPPK
jgi:hypothetical protein